MQGDSMPETNPDAAILVVDDEERVAESYSLRLGMRYDDVHTANGGNEAIAFLEASEADVVLLDRRMPDMSGDDVAQVIQERDYDTRVIMVTAVDPDFDVVEMSFDDYLQKPVDKEDMFGAVEQQLIADTYDEELSEYFSVRSKIAVLTAEKSSHDLQDNNKYQRLVEKAEQLEMELDETVDEFDDLADQFTNINRE